jgi:hypothetical protein
MILRGCRGRVAVSDVVWGGGGLGWGLPTMGDNRLIGKVIHAGLISKRGQGKTALGECVGLCVCGWVGGWAVFDL